MTVPRDTSVIQTMATERERRESESQQRHNLCHECEGSRPCAKSGFGCRGPWMRETNFPLGGARAEVAAWMMGSRPRHYYVVVPFGRASLNVFMPDAILSVCSRYCIRTPKQAALYLGTTVYSWGWKIQCGLRDNKYWWESGSSKDPAVIT